MSNFEIVEIISWFCFIWILYIYFFYPFILWIIHSFLKRPVKKGEFEPSISFFISAYNEESVILEKLENVLKLDYPKDKLEIIVVSDASTDRTDEIVNSYSDKGVRLFRMSERGGKIPGLNDAIPASTGEILILSDANCMYNTGALRALASNFADERIGAVNGEHIFLNKRESTVERGVGFYWKYETWLKRMESAIHSNVFITGAMIAVRRELYPENITGELNLDNVLPTCIVEKGYRVVYEDGAVVTEETAKNLREDFQGRIRTTIRGFWFVRYLRRFISISKHPFFVFHLLCRKVFRWLVAPFLIVLFFGNIYLFWQGPNYRYCFAVQIIFYLSAIIGFFLNRSKIKFKFFNIIYYFCMINLAALIGFLRFLRGDKMSTWSHASRKH
ncbi:MAG: glycosyltransferase family 2 protein [bacterium]